MDKNYSSIYNIKDFVSSEIAPKYFNMDQVNDLNVGLLGYTTELITGLTEDNFNTVTMYINEMFPNLAVLPESIYNYGALFHTDGSFATASEMDVLLLVSETDILNNSNRISDTLYEFYLDSDMIIDVEGVQFMPDYDIRINYKRQNNGITFTAQYVQKRYNAEYKNPITTIKNPYIKTKRIAYANTKYLILMVKTHRINRFSMNETVLSNDVINAPTYTIEFDGQLASFDVFYKESGASAPIQLSKRLSGTSPSTTPFCYYKVKDENKLEITFTTRDTYFQPAFNSEITIDYSVTTGEDGNFPIYTGNDVTVIPSSEKYAYNNGLILFAIPQSASYGGKNKLKLEQLKSIVTEMFSTVGSYTNENDLQLYFANFKNNLDTDILFIKKRDDIFERLFAAFSMFKDVNGDIYHTNTTNIKIKPGLVEEGGDFDIRLDQSDIMIMKPGHVFKYCNDVLDCIEIDPESGVLTPDNERVLNADRSIFLYTNPFLIYFTKQPAAIGYYLNTVNRNYIVDYKYVNSESIVQFICNSLTVSRNAIIGEDSYKITAIVSPTTELDSPIVEVITNGDGDEVETITGALRLTLTVEDFGTELCYLDMELVDYDLENQLYTYSCDIKTDDNINLSGKFNITNMNDIQYMNDMGDDEHLTITQPIPMTDCIVNIYTKYSYAKDTVKNDTGKIISRKYTTTNKYTTETDPITFIQPVQMIRSTVLYSNNNDGTYGLFIKSVPVVRARTFMNAELAMDFYTALANQFNYVSDVLDKLLNNYSVDMKFYNTYGRSKNFYVGDNGDKLLDRVNISLHIKVKPVFGVVEEEFVHNLKIYIKNYIENINTNGTNSIYISNLIQSLENDFPDLSYMKFVGINNYDSTTQVIDNKTVDLNTLTKEDRINYVPEYLTISLDDIIIDIIR